MHIDSFIPVLILSLLMTLIFYWNGQSTLKLLYCIFARNIEEYCYRRICLTKVPPKWNLRIFAKSVHFIHTLIHARVIFCWRVELIVLQKKIFPIFGLYALWVKYNNIKIREKCNRWLLTKLSWIDKVLSLFNPW